MAISCLGLDAAGRLPSSETSEPSEETTSLPPAQSDGAAPSQLVGEETLKQGDYRDILSLTRVLTHGPKSKAEVDLVIER